jgi:PPM family protein phosphatase
MACVLTLAVLEGRQLTIGHVGDSRLYKLDARGISKLTHDHSPVGELEDAREISETEAMLDERRNEVYRDVGSEPRDPEADDFIEIVRATFDDQSAVLICSDGLSDMLPALEINRIVRRHATMPEAAVAALAAAANEVGGTDNITVVLVTGREFSRTPDGGRAFPPPPPQLAAQVPTIPLADVPSGAPSSAATLPESHWLRTALTATLRSRAFWFVVGLLPGLALLMVSAGVIDPVTLRLGSRSLRVAGPGGSSFATIGAALANARPGDVVEVAAGEYAEAVEIPAGVELRAAAPDRAVLVAPAGVSSWTAITMRGDGSRVQGFRISGSPRAAVTRGVAIIGANAVVDDVAISGDVGVGVDIEGPGATVSASRFDRLAGAALRIAHEGASVRQNIFRSGGETGGPAIQSVGGAAAALDGNVFLHFPRVVEPAALSQELLGRDNFEILAAPRR